MAINSILIIDCRITYEVHHQIVGTTLPISVIFSAILLFPKSHETHLSIFVNLEFLFFLSTSRSDPIYTSSGF